MRSYRYSKCAVTSIPLSIIFLSALASFVKALSDIPRSVTHRIIMNSSTTAPWCASPAILNKTHRHSGSRNEVKIQISLCRGYIQWTMLLNSWSPPPLVKTVLSAHRWKCRRTAPSSQAWGSCVDRGAGVRQEWVIFRQWGAVAL